MSVQLSQMLLTVLSIDNFTHNNEQILFRNVLESKNYHSTQSYSCCEMSVYLSVCPSTCLHATNLNTVFPRIIAGGDYFYFRTKRGRLFEGRRLFEGGDYFKYFSQEVVKK